MDIVLGNKRLSAPVGWLPSFTEFKRVLLLHSIIVDFTKEYEKLYGRIDKKVGESKKATKRVQRPKKGSGNTKS